MAKYERKTPLKPPTVILNSKSDLHKLLKKLTGEEDEILAFLSKTYKDEKVDIKLRVECATKLLDKRISVSESITKETITKMITVAKLSEGSSTTIGQSYAAPRAIVDFNSIQKIDGVDYNELDKETNSVDMRDVGSFE